MAGGAAWAAVADGLIGLGTQWMNNKYQQSANDQDRQWQYGMYQMQRQDALADYNMQNQYNSPQAQMQRLRDAGLNPALVGGNMSGNVAAAAPVRQANPGEYHPKPLSASGFGSSVSSALTNYFNIRQQEAQTDNLKKQNDVYTQDALLKAAQTASIAMQTARSTYDLDLAKSLRSNTLEASELSVRKQQQDLAAQGINIDLSLQRNEREKKQLELQTVAQNTALREAEQRIISSKIMNAKTQAERQQILTITKGEEYQNEVKKLDAEIAKSGARPGDNALTRMLEQILHKLGVGASNFIKPFNFNPIPSTDSVKKRLFHNKILNSH